MASDEQLRREIDYLGRTFGEVIREYAGEEQFELVEQVRRGARLFCEGSEEAGDDLDELLASLSEGQLRIVVRAFSIFLELANLAEDRQRIRALRHRERAKHPAPRKESIAASISELKQRGLTWKETSELLSKIDIDLVFTAHPTEAKRRSLRAKLRAIRGLLSDMDDEGTLPRERVTLEKKLRSEIIKLWQTDFVRARRPTVLEEVRRGLSFQPVLWPVVPQILGELREAVSHEYDGVKVDDIASVLRFGSWMGGDRDGHPHVTPPITQQTCEWLRDTAIGFHLKSCRRLAESLSISQHESPEAADLSTAIDTARLRWPAVQDEVDLIPPRETYRRWLRIVRWRLEQTQAAKLKGPWPEGAYRSALELSADVRRVSSALLASGNDEVANLEVVTWLDQIRVFGFHTARLDLRQHSEVYRQSIDEIWRAAQLCGADEQLTDEARMRLLAETMSVAPNIDPVGLSETARETLDLFTTIRRLARRYGMAALGGHVISMTTSATDILTVLWFWNWSRRVDGGDDRDDGLLLPIVPLLETIDDLNAAVKILDGAFNSEIYRDYVRRQGDHQMIMVGYSDSTKDGSYLTAAWSLYRVQVSLHELAAERGVELTFFHGRGGSLGRGGGPTARAILSLPSETFHGSLRLTEQGEVLAERYDDPAIAHRHLEQVVWSVIMAATHRGSKTPSEWQPTMDQMADASLERYRKLVDHGTFVEFFRHATPISEIERLPIGSRPAKRKGGERIEDLRAIPWVFSWTQSRFLLPAWYGLGTGLQAVIDTPDGAEKLQTMYQHWPFFRATIDNATLALAKSNLPVFRRYVAAAGDTPGIAEVAEMLIEEFEIARKAILTVTQTQELLDNTPWLQTSILARNGYVDPLNLVQVELLRRRRDPENRADQSFDELCQLTIKGVAAGMRTTG